MSCWFHWQDNTLTLHLHLQPNAKTNEIVGPHGDALKIRISAPPIGGKANAHLLIFLASTFGVKKKQIQLLSGDSSRSKRVAITSPKNWPSPWFDHIKHA